MGIHCKNMGLLSLPEDVLLCVISGLTPKDLAAMSLQCCLLNDLINTSPVWEDHCKLRWTSHGIPWTLAEVCDWAVVYRQLAALPNDVVQSVGRLCKTDLKVWGEAVLSATEYTSSLEHDDPMQAIYDVGVEAVMGLDMLSYAVTVVQYQLCNWLLTGPHVLLAYARYVHEKMLPFYLPPFWDDPAEESMYDVAWRRSALDFLPWILAGGIEPCQDTSRDDLDLPRTLLTPVLRALAFEAEKIDTRLLDACQDGPIGMPNTLEGVPESHWWFCLYRVAPSDILRHIESLPE